MKDYLHTVLPPEQLRQMNLLALAHVGDGVYELLVRTLLCASGTSTAKKLHFDTVQRVCASAQARASTRILPVLTEEESDIFRRGRNAKVHSVPKAAALGDYHAATALEALFGYLYLSGQTERINELFALTQEPAEA